MPVQLVIPSPFQSCDNRATSAYLYRGKQYYRGIVVATYYSHTLPPNAKRRDCIRGTGVDRGTLGNAQFHTGGCNVVLGDGGVHFVSDSIDANVWRAVGSRADGEVANVDW